MNTLENLLEIKNIKSKHVENKINLSSIKGILLSNSAKAFLKAHKNSLNNLIISQESLSVSNTEYIPFNLLIDEGMIDLIAPNLQIFNGFQKAIEELINKKKNYSIIFKYLDK